MGFFENMWHKMGFGEDKDTQASSILPLQEVAESPQQQEQSQMIVPTIGKEEILQPLNIFLKKVVAENTLPPNLSTFVHTMEQYAQNPSLSLAHFHTLVGQIQTEMAQVKQEKQTAEQSFAEQTAIKKGIVEVKGWKGVLEQIQGNNDIVDEITHENFLESPQNKQMVQIQQLLKQFNGGNLEEEFSPEMQTKFQMFAEQILQLGQNVEEFTAKISEFRKEETQLKEDIQSFSKVLSKVNTMGSGAVEKYYDQLTATQKQLNERREEYLKGEQMINQYIGVLNGSVVAYVQSFKAYIPALKQVMESIITKTSETHAELLQKNMLEQDIQSLGLSFEQLQKLQYKITEFAQLHSEFTPQPQQKTR